MAEIWMDVDTALSEVPVNIAPLIDDTDFKTVEDAIAYNASGMDLRWNFVTTGGSFTSTAVTPTTGGTYDWTHQGDGMYTIEIPASGGASINNDTEGFGWFSGKVTGVLPWRGPVIGFRAAAINNALIDGGTGNINTDVKAVQGDSNAATGLSTAGTSYQAYGHFDTNFTLVSTEISAVNSQTEFVLTDGLSTDDVYNGLLVVITGADATERHYARVTDYVGSTRTLTIDAAASWTVVVTDEINVLAVPKQVTALPTATAGTANGVFIAGTNAATSITTALTANITGNLSGSVGSVTGAVGSVTGNVGGNVTGSVGSVVGAVGSVTGNVGGNVTGSVGSVTGNVGGNVVGSVGSISGVTFPTNFGSLDIDASGFVVLQDDSIVTAKLGTFTLAKTTNITGFNDLDAAGVRTAVGLASANLDTQLAAIQADLPVRFTKNVAYTTDFAFFMVDTSGDPATGLTVSGQISKDGGSFTSLTNAITEIASGWYKVAGFTQTEMNANMIALRFTATGAKTRNLAFITQPT